MFTYNALLRNRFSESNSIFCLSRVNCATPLSKPFYNAKTIDGHLPNGHFEDSLIVYTVQLHQNAIVTQLVAPPEWPSAHSINNLQRMHSHEYVNASKKSECVHVHVYLNFGNISNYDRMTYFHILASVLFVYTVSRN